MYAAFDIYPGSKGAATHITHMAGGLFRYFGNGALLTLGSQASSELEYDGPNMACRFVQQIPNYLERAQAFTGFVEKTLETMPNLEVVHYRDIWSAMGVLNPPRAYKTVFEVNALPSIELPYHYPSLSNNFLGRLQKIEDRCLSESDRIIVPSYVIREGLLKRGVDERKLSVIPNGADLITEAGLPDPSLGEYIIYFGAVQAWQGVDVLIKSMGLLKDLSDLNLLICSSSKPSQTKELRRLTRRLGLEHRVIWKYQLDKVELNRYIQGASLSLAPLSECSRNITQGCSPLKIFESMACGTAVIASKIPVVEEILQDGVSGKLVSPDRPQELARAIRLLLEYPEQRSVLAKNAKKLIEDRFNWPKIGLQLDAVYARLSSDQNT